MLLHACAEFPSVVVFHDVPSVRYFGDALVDTPALSCTSMRRVMLLEPHVPQRTWSVRSSSPLAPARLTVLPRFRANALYCPDLVTVTRVCAGSAQAEGKQRTMAQSARLGAARMAGRGHGGSRTPGGGKG